MRWKFFGKLLNVELRQLKFFRLVTAKILDIPVIVSRTGYTGDLGYELWFGAEHAERIWDYLTAQGSDYGIKPTGMLALDVARLEAGFILLEVDYVGAEKALIPSQRYSPFEIGLGWTVDLKKEHFIGSRVLRKSSEGARHGKSSAWKSTSMTMNIYISRADCRHNFRSQPGEEECHSTKTTGKSAMRPRAPGRRP